MSHPTPFEAVHQKLGATFADHFGWNMPSRFTDLTSELNSLYTASAVFDLSNFGRITIKGADSKQLLNCLLATNLDALFPDSWIWAIICCDQGTVIDIVRVASVNNSFVIYTSPAKRQMVLDLAKQCAQKCAPNTNIDSIAEKTGMLGLYGPRAVEAIIRILPFDIEHLEPGDATAMSFFMMPITILRGSFAGTDGLELICPKGAAAMAASAISKYREKEGLTPAGFQSLESAMIHAALPTSIINSPKGCKLTPATLNLMSLVDLNKDFNGKDAVQSAVTAGTKTRIVGIKTPKGAIHTDLTIQHDNGEIGFCPMIVPSNKLNANIGLAIVDSEYANFDGEVQVVSDDLIAAGEIVSLPFDSTVTVEFAK